MVEQSDKGSCIKWSGEVDILIAVYIFMQVVYFLEFSKAC